MLVKAAKKSRRELPDFGGRQVTVVPRRIGNGAGSRHISEGGSRAERDRGQRPEERRSDRHRMEER